jgi:MOSC domain-containing protein YiiM
MTDYHESRTGEVLSVSRSEMHTFSKQTFETIRLLAGLGVEGDAHMGTTVKHRSRVAQNPNQPNLRQVHLIHSELFDELLDADFHVQPGQLGENITTCRIDLLRLPAGTKLNIGKTAVIEITGLRNPCKQIDDFQSGLLSAVLDHDKDGNLVRKAGVMSIVVTGGEVRVGDSIRVSLPAKPFRPLERV